jgi:RNA polymerase subunit RPABC4/transcription elongation factor Spt4
MALINCSECGKQVSEKAASCPSCGNPITVTSVIQPSSSNVNYAPINKENLLSCPKCNSTELTSNKKGFSGGKALAGAVLTGGIGLLAGTIGSGNVIITCLKCGHNFKAGEYSKEKEKFDKEREFNKRLAKGKESYVGTIILFLVFSVIGSIISYKLWVNGWIFMGLIFSVATLICIAMFIFSIHSESNRKPVE